MLTKGSSTKGRCSMFQMSQQSFAATAPYLPPLPTAVNSRKEKFVLDGEGHDLLDLDPTWPSTKDLRHLCSLAQELVALWADIGASVGERLLDAESLCRTAQARVHSWRRRQSEFAARCEAVRQEAQHGVDALAGEFADELRRAARQSVLHLRLRALEAVLDTVRQRLRFVEGMRKAAAEVIAALGLTPEQLAALGLRPEDLVGLTPAQLEAKLAQLRDMLIERRNAALKPLGMKPTPIHANNLVDEICALKEQMQEAEAKLRAMRTAALAAARRARSIWEELGEDPVRPRDERVLAIVEAATRQLAEASIDHRVAAATAASKEAWEKQRAEVVREQQRLHRALYSFGSVEEVEPFLQKHGTLLQTDLAACREKLEELKAAALLGEAPLRKQLRRLYEAAGADLDELEAFFAKVAKAESKDKRISMLEQEIKRMDEYLESISVILGRLEELKALVVAAASFEHAVQTGAGRFTGLSLHFLEEEKFRKRFMTEFPHLRDSLIEEIQTWETAHSQQFFYRGEELRQRLIGACQFGVELVKLPGDLSVVGHLQEVLAVPVVSTAKRKKLQAASDKSLRKRPPSLTRSVSEKVSKSSSGPKSPSTPSTHRSISAPPSNRSSPASPALKRVRSKPPEVPLPSPMGRPRPPPPRAPGGVSSLIAGSVRK